MKTELKDRTLWFDGTNEIEPSQLINFVMEHPCCVVSTTSITPDVLHYNKFVDANEKITIKHQNKSFNFGWNIPQRFLDLDIKTFIISKLDEELEKRNWDIDSKQAKMRLKRVANELQVYEQKELFDLLRVLIYVINTLEQNNCVWGVGRGSSVSSYILYLIGVHDIDSVLYDINLSDFIGEKYGK